MFDLLFCGATIITMLEDGILENAYLGVEKGKIVYLSQTPPQKKSKRTIGAKNMLIMPGLINTHSHLRMSLLRGYADDFSLHNWLSYISPAEDVTDDTCSYLAATLGIAEMLMSGTIAVSDMDSHLPAVATAAYDSGIKASLCTSAMCSYDNKDFVLERDPSYKELQKALELHDSDNGRIIIDMGIHGEYTSSQELCKQSAEFAVKNGLRTQLHLSETIFEHNECIDRYAKTPAKYFYDLGVFESITTAAHCVAVSDEDIEILKKRNVTVAHNPISNLKLASGIARIVDIKNAGVNIALGTDSVCSNNSLDLFEELKLSALLQKGITADVSAITSCDALKMATVNGALAQGREHECGKIALGMDADIIMLDTNNPKLYPSYDPISTAVYSANGSCVVMTVVRGKILYENGKLTSIDLERLYSEIEYYALPRIIKARG